MSYVVPFMNPKGGVGKSVLARTYAVEAARAGASVLIADLDGDQRTSKRWADQRKANGFRPEITVKVATARQAYDMAERAEVLVIDAPGWTDRETLRMAAWATFCVIPSRANRMDDLSETVRLLHKLKEQWWRRRRAPAIPSLRNGWPMKIDLKSVHRVKKVLADGTVRFYYYLGQEKGASKLDGEPGTPEFIASWEKATAKRKAEDRLTDSLIDEYFDSGHFQHRLSKRTSPITRRWASNSGRSSARRRCDSGKTRARARSCAGGVTSLPRRRRSRPITCGR